jgi:hypothetical protein
MVAPQKIHRNINETCFLTFTSIFKTMGDKEKYRDTQSVLKVPVVYLQQVTRAHTSHLLSKNTYSKLEL